MTLALLVQYAQGIAERGQTHIRVRIQRHLVDSQAMRPELLTQ